MTPIDTPTPDDAQRALRDIEHRRQQAVEAAGWSRWWWIGGGILVAVYGITLDLHPDVLGGWGGAIPIVLAAIGVLSTTRRGGALAGRRVGARTPKRPLVAILVVASIVVLSLVFRAVDLPHASAVVAVVGGLVLAIGGPWWQRAVLNR